MHHFLDADDLFDRRGALPCSSFLDRLLTILVVDASFGRRVCSALLRGRRAAEEPHAIPHRVEVRHRSIGLLLRLAHPLVNGCHLAERGGQRVARGRALVVVGQAGIEARALGRRRGGRRGGRALCRVLRVGVAAVVGALSARPLVARLGPLPRGELVHVVDVVAPSVGIRPLLPAWRERVLRRALVERRANLGRGGDSARRSGVSRRGGPESAARVPIAGERRADRSAARRSGRSCRHTGEGRDLVT
mmetsp:Transcript_25660/g.53746  ORF Transcript_25660/g.53746 Transcript_25660/m.53746 type:complete len:248 (-) Transcript_25660:520-1263(-)